MNKVRHHELQKPEDSFSNYLASLRTQSVHSYQTKRPPSEIHEDLDLPRDSTLVDSGILNDDVPAVARMSAHIWSRFESPFPLIPDMTTPLLFAHAISTTAFYIPAVVTSPRFDRRSSTDTLNLARSLTV